MNSNTKLAAAIAAVLASAGSGYAVAAVPTLAQANSAPVQLIMAGSSAAKPAVLSALQTNLCGGASNALTVISAPNGNFLAVSCFPSSTTGLAFANGTTAVTVKYRFEGGSVTGALPIVSGKPISTLDLNSASTNYSPASCASVALCTATVTGTSGTNGIDDSFAGAVVKAGVQFGITDVEPGALILDNYPSAYLTSVYGTATAGQLGALAHNPLFDQVFGIFVNKSTFSNTAPNLSKAMITNLLQGNVIDWTHVEDVNGSAISTTATPVAIVNREAGSGSRTSAAIYFTGDECVTGASSISDIPGGTSDFFSTGDVLAKANTTAGAITYASIDNLNTTKYPNLVLVGINGITPSNLAAAQGQYDFWFEATDVYSPTLTGNPLLVAQYLEGKAQAIATAPHLVDILAIPGASTNVAGLPAATANGSPVIYVNPFTRSLVSCATPFSGL
jgi:hypothetical protein